MYYDSYFYVQNESPDLIKDIEKAINQQFSAIKCYKQLANLAPSEEEKKRIQEIRKDEIKHFETFSEIYFNLTGKKPTPKIVEKCATVYKEGLELSIEDEQKAVDFYLDIVEKAQDLYIKEKFQRAAADEQNHAVWFLYFYTKLGFKSN